MQPLDLVLRWAHILPAMALLGGALFMRLALHPAAETLPAEQAATLKGAARARWRHVVRLSILLLLISGLTNFVLTVQRYEVEKPLYHMVFGIKFLLALGIFFLAEMLNGRSELAEKFRARSAFWLNVLLALAITLVCLSGVLKLSPHTPKAAATTTR